MSETEVLIVGAGPVGLSMGIECLRHGLKFRLIDRLPFPSDKSKALGIWSAAQEVFSAMGVIEPILHASLHVKAGRLCRGKHTLLRMTPGDQVDTPYPDALVLPQCDTERILTKRLEELGGRVERGTEFVSFAQDRTGVKAALKQPDGRDEIIRCQFLVGCDGARSTVRQLAGVTFGGESMVEIWVLCDAEIAGSSLAPKEAHVFLSPKGPLPLFPIRGNVWRVISTRPASAGLDLPTLSEMQQHLNERGPGGLTLKNPAWLSFFRISERQVDRYVSGNVLLSGDAAHVHSPAGGQGMNTGVQDSFNLGWKLALILREGADRDVLLKSYHAERHPVAAMVIARAAAQTRMNMIHSAIGRLVRDGLLWCAGRTQRAPRAVAFAYSGLDIRYSKSPVLSDDTAWHANWRAHGFRPGERPRDVPVYCPVQKRTVSLFHSLHGTQHVLLLFSGKRPAYRDGGLLESIRLLVAGHESIVRVLRVWAGDQPPQEDWFLDGDLAAHRRYGVYQPALYLIRPDGYVGVRAQPAAIPAVADYFRGLRLAKFSLERGI